MARWFLAAALTVVLSFGSSLAQSPPNTSFVAPSIKAGFGATCNGSVDDSGHFTTADGSTGFSEIGVYDHCVINDNISLNHAVRIAYGGSINIGAGYTVNFNGGLVSESASPLPGAGTAMIGNNQLAYQMFGSPMLYNFPPAGGGAASYSRFTSTAYTQPFLSARQYINNFGMISGTGEAYIGSPVAAAGSVAANTGADCAPHTGDCWAGISALEMLPASGPYSGFSQELDVYNQNVPLGNTGGIIGAIYRPYSYGTIYDGSGVNAATAAIGIDGAHGAWNNGIVAMTDNIRSVVLLDGSNATVGYDVQGNHVYALDFSGMPYGSTRLSLVSPGVCTAQPPVTFAGGGGTFAAATAYLGVLDSSTINNAGTGYAVGDTIRFLTSNVPPASADDVYPVAEVLSVNLSGAVTSFSFAYKDPITPPTTLSTSASMGDTTISLSDATGVAIGDIISVALDTQDIQQVFAIGVGGTTVTISAPLRQNATVTMMSKPQVIDLGRRSSRGTLTATTAIISQDTTSGGGTGFSLNASYGVSTLWMTNFGTGYSAAPTVTIDASGTDCPGNQPVAAALAGGIPMRLANGAPIVAVGNPGGDVPLIHLDANNNIEMGSPSTPTIFEQQAVLSRYTVGSLPMGILGGTAYVSDAISCTFMVMPSGGGSTPCPVFFNGSQWVAH